MKKQLALLLCLVFAATGTMVQAQTTTPVAQPRQAELRTWKTYTVKGEHFSVSLPTVPAMTTDEMYLISLRKRRRERMLGAYADGAVYSVYVYENITHQSLEDFITEHAGREGYDRSTERIVNVGDFKGKEYSATNKARPFIVQLFAEQGRLYKFSVGGVNAEDAGSKQFFSSISLGKKADGIDVSDGPGVLFSHPTGDELLTGKQVDVKARLYQKPEPRYTERARQEQIVGTVVLKVVFSSSGSVNNIVTVKDLPHGLTEQAIAAARKIKFVPAMKDGKYVSMWMQLEYNFNLY